MPGSADPFRPRSAHSRSRGSRSSSSSGRRSGRSRGSSGQSSRARSANSRSSSSSSPSSGRSGLSWGTLSSGSGGRRSGGRSSGGRSSGGSGRSRSPRRDSKEVREVLEICARIFGMKQRQRARLAREVGRVAPSMRDRLKRAAKRDDGRELCKLVAEANYQRNADAREAANTAGARVLVEAAKRGNTAAVRDILEPAATLLAEKATKSAPPDTRLTAEAIVEAARGGHVEILGLIGKALRSPGPLRPGGLGLSLGIKKPKRGDSQTKTVETALRAAERGGHGRAVRAFFEKNEPFQEILRVASSSSF